MLLEMFSGITFNRPVHMVEFGDGFLVVEQVGTVKYVQGDNVKTLIDLRRKVRFGGEMGLLGLAVSPKFEKDSTLFLSYTDKNFFSVISRYHLPTGKEEVILKVKQPYSNHNGGHIVFGPDGYLYIGLGDGGSAGDPLNNAQNTKTLLGSILRIDVFSKKPYAIPKDNPFYGSKYCSENCPEIYAWGLRNPWKFSFDMITGTLWAGDVGQDRWEEVDTIVKGGNYGWRCYEGNHPFNLKGCKSKENYIFPVYEYRRIDGNCSVIGGYVYRGDIRSEYYGWYVFGDFCSGRIWAYRDGKLKLIIDTNFMISSFAQDNNGNIYVLDYRSGKIYKLNLERIR